MPRSPLMEKKKKPDFIIPPTYYRNNSYSIAEVQSLKSKVPDEKVAESTTQKAEEVEKVVTTTTNHPHTTDNQQPLALALAEQPKVSSMSLSSIRAKKEMTENLKLTVKEVVYLPSEPFTETQMLEQWLKYAQRMEDKGFRILASLLTINDPTLEGITIIHELPNESSKIDFEKEKPELLGYLRGKLHNHDIRIDVKVNETLIQRKSYTAQDKYNRLAELNPNLEVMRNLFGLEINE